MWLDSKYQTGQNSSLLWLFLVVAAAAKSAPKKVFDKEIPAREKILNMQCSSRYRSSQVWKLSHLSSLY